MHAPRTVLGWGRALRGWWLWGVIWHAGLVQQSAMLQFGKEHTVVSFLAVCHPGHSWAKLAQRGNAASLHTATLQKPKCPQTHRTRGHKKGISRKCPGRSLASGLTLCKRHGTVNTKERKETPRKKRAQGRDVSGGGPVQGGSRKREKESVFSGMPPGLITAQEATHHCTDSEN